MMKPFYLTLFVLFITNTNLSNATIGCFGCNQQREALPILGHELKTNKLSKPCIAVFYYLSTLNPRNEEAGIPTFPQNTSSKKQHRIILFQKKEKVDGKDDIYTLSFSLNTDIDELQIHPEIADILFEKLPDTFSDEENEQHRRGDVEIIHINDINQFLSKHGDQRGRLKKMFLVTEDNIFTGKGKYGPHGRWKLANKGIKLEVSSTAYRVMTEVVSNMLTKRKEKYAPDENEDTATTSKIKTQEIENEGSDTSENIEQCDDLT